MSAHPLPSGARRTQTYDEYANHGAGGSRVSSNGGASVPRSQSVRDRGEF
jgi:hypothetical protein